jgi:ubiquinone/menaquinone biosynthesis C-methylase UbiE
MKAWDEIWKTAKSRSPWVLPDPFVVSSISKFKEENIEKILDLGLGLGRHAVLFAKEGFIVHGLDTSPTGIKYAIRWSKKEDVILKLTLGEMSQIPFIDDSFDLIIAWNVIYHGTVNYILKTMSEIERCLQMKGYLLCTFISKQNEKYRLGEEIEEDTFINTEEKEKSYPHHYFDIDEINRYLDAFTIIECEDKEQFLPRSYHWNIIARLTNKSVNI